ncbi:hypothetical protein [Actinomadura monticuli]|uniref:Uncharacterized protein n=1 Tax=Actinomadura monticuli TaxID=3097367 RepID=A0ABV4QJX1_9ACTN
MSRPEENAPKTDDTDRDAVEPDGGPDREAQRREGDRTELGAELADKMAEKGLSRDDFSES